MKLSTWASIAEIVASLSVVVTLIVLIVGVRENSDLVRASAYSENLQSINDVQAVVLSDPDAVRAYTALINGNVSRLDDEDRMRVLLIVLSMFRSYESAYFDERYGLLGQQEWQRFGGNICFFLARALAAGIDGPIRETVTDEFMAYVEDQCRDRP
jgi:hypothetical protein